jgi:hypothetical protein
MEHNVLGLVVAALSVVSSGMQQIFCRTMQQKHALSSHELLSNTAPAQAKSPPPLFAWRLCLCPRTLCRLRAVCCPLSLV